VKSKNMEQKRNLLQNFLFFLYFF